MKNQILQAIDDFLCLFFGEREEGIKRNDSTNVIVFLGLIIFIFFVGLLVRR